MISQDHDLISRGGPHPLIEAADLYNYQTSYEDGPVVSFHHADHVVTCGACHADRAFHRPPTCEACHDEELFPAQLPGTKVSRR